MKNEMEHVITNNDSVPTPASNGSKTPESNQRLKPGLVALAVITEANTGGCTLIRLLGEQAEIQALSSQAYSSDDIGKTVACISVHGSDQMMIVGVVTQSAQAELAHSDTMLGRLIDSYQEQDQVAEDIEVFDTPAAKPATGDPENELVFEAGRSLTFKCGESSISLTADGRVNIRGKFVNNGATHLNRISGGSVKIN